MGFCCSNRRFPAFCTVVLVLAVNSAFAENRTVLRTAGTRTADRSSSTTGKRDAKSAGKLQVKVVQRGSSSKAVHKQADSDLPLRRLSSESRGKAKRILESSSLYRRLPTVSFPSDHQTYQFFTSFPEVAVSIWRVMKISKCEMWQTGPDTYEMDAGDGSIGVVEVLYRSRDETMIMCDGLYTSPLLVKPIKASCLICLKSKFSTDENGRPFVTHHADMYVSFPSNTVEVAAKLISPVSNLLADRNFLEVSMFLELMSVAMQNQPGWMERVADRMDGVLPIRKKQILKTTARVYIESRKRMISKSSGQSDVSVNEVLKPLRDASKNPDSSIEELIPIEIGELVKTAGDNDQERDRR